MVHFLATFRLVEMTPLSADSSQESPRRRTTRNSSKKDTKSVSAYTVSNLTLISLLLVKFGPMSERNTALAVIGVQIGCSLLAFTIRYGLVHIVYNDSQEE